MKRVSYLSLAGAGDVPIIDDDTPTDFLFPKWCGRGHDPSQYVPEMLAGPLDEMDLIDPSEYEGRWKEEEETRSSLEHIYLDAGWENLDQGSEGFCHDDKTEVLTERGWVRWAEYNWSDLLGTVNQGSGFLEFQQPFQRHVYEYDGELIHSINRRLDFGVTPDHRMLVRKWSQNKRTLSNEYTFQRAGNLGWYTGLMPAPRGFIGTELTEIGVEGDRQYDGDDFLALLALVTSDGYAGGTENTKNWVSFASFREETRPVVTALAVRIGFRECPGRPGVFIRYNAAALAAWMRANCYTGGGLGARNKRVPDLVKAASTRQIKHFLHWFDDRDRTGRQYYSTSQRIADDLQELFLRIGKRLTISRAAPKEVAFAGNKAGVIRSGSSFVLTVGQADRLCLESKKQVVRDRYKGLVYCAAVPNRTLVTRRNGSVLISGNCWAYSTGHCVMLLRSMNRQPYIRLNPHGVGAVIKGGRNEGGWCGLSAKFLAEVGIPSGEFWPGHSLDVRRHDTPAMRANAALHKVVEPWMDLGRPVHGQVMTERQIDTCVFTKQPCALDFNWWSHSVCYLRKVQVEAGNWGRLIVNSWKGWGRRGLAVLRGSKANPDGAVALGVTGASTV